MCKAAGGVRVRRIRPAAKAPCTALFDLDAVRRVSLVADRSTPIRMAFTDGNLALNAGQGDDAQASEQLMTYLDVSLRSKI